MCFVTVSVFCALRFQYACKCRVMTSAAARWFHKQRSSGCLGSDANTIGTLLARQLELDYANVHSWRMALGLLDNISYPIPSLELLRRASHGQWMDALHYVSITTSEDACRSSIPLIRWCLPSPVTLLPQDVIMNVSVPIYSSEFELAARQLLASKHASHHTTLLERLADEVMHFRVPSRPWQSELHRFGVVGELASQFFCRRFVGGLMDEEALPSSWKKCEALRRCLMGYAKEASHITLDGDDRSLVLHSCAIASELGIVSWRTLAEVFSAFNTHTKMLQLWMDLYSQTGVFPRSVDQMLVVEAIGRWDKAAALVHNQNEWFRQVGVSQLLQNPTHWKLALQLAAKMAAEGDATSWMKTSWEIALNNFAAVAAPSPALFSSTLDILGGAPTVEGAAAFVSALATSEVTKGRHNVVLRDPRVLSIALQASAAHWLTALNIVSTIKPKVSTRRSYCRLLKAASLWEAALNCTPTEELHTVAPSLLSNIPVASRWSAALSVLSRVKYPRTDLLLTVLRALDSEAPPSAQVDLVVEMGQPSSRIKLMVEGAHIGSSQSKLKHQFRPRSWQPALFVASQLPVGVLRQRTPTQLLDNILLTMAESNLWCEASNLYTKMKENKIKISSTASTAIQHSTKVSTYSRAPVDNEQLESALRHRNWMEGIRLYSAVQSPSMSTLSRLLRVCNFDASWKVSLGLLREALRLHTSERTSESLPFEVFAGSLNSLAKAARWEEVLTLVMRDTEVLHQRRVSSQYAVLIAKACRKAGKWERAIQNFQVHRDVIKSAERGTSFAILSETIAACTSSGLPLTSVYMLLTLEGKEKKTKEFLFSTDTTVAPQLSPDMVRLCIAVLSARSRTATDTLTWARALDLISSNDVGLDVVGSEGCTALVDICLRQDQWVKGIQLLRYQTLVGVPPSRHSVHQLLERLSVVQRESTSLWVSAMHLFSVAHASQCVDRLVRDQTVNCLAMSGNWVLALHFMGKFDHFNHFVMRQVLEGMQRCDADPAQQGVLASRMIGARSPSPSVLSLAAETVRVLVEADQWRVAIELLTKSDCVLKKTKQWRTLEQRCQVVEKYHTGSYEEAAKVFRELSSVTATEGTVQLYAALSHAKLASSEELPDEEKRTHLASLESLACSLALMYPEHHQRLLVSLPPTLISQVELDV